MDQTKRFSPIVTPDSLREKLHLSKKFYDTHTKKNVGYQDINGLEYSGTVENFGSEMVLETHKLHMDRPSLETLKLDDKLSYYFDLRFSPEINTYTHQNVVMLVLKKNVLLDGYQYRIIMEHCKKQYAVRSFDDGDDIVRKVQCYEFTGNPTLQIISRGGGVMNYQLHIDDGSGVSPRWFYEYTTSTYRYIDDGEFISHYNIQTVSLTNDMAGLPFLWVCLDGLKTFPPNVLKNNLDTNGNPLLTFGTDGHNKQHLYPWTYGEKNVPSVEEKDENYQWFIRAYAKENISGELSKIEYVYTDNIDDEPAEVHEIELDLSYMRIKLVSQEIVNWKTSEDEESNLFAYVSLNEFEDNYLDQDEFMIMNKMKLIEMKPLFDVFFDEGYLNQFEYTNRNAVSGIHVDYTSDKSENAVSKKNGTIHNLGDFDGLPPYYKYYINDTVKRPHVEIYSIRDAVNDNNQTSLDKHTSALLIDPGIPQNQLSDITDGLESVIRFDITQRRTYVTKGESVSPTNQLSDIVFISREKFADSNIKIYSNFQRFVYHGKRRFSAGIMGFDPITETGRVYYISNDPAVYENNELSESPKPPTTLARICDIPTSFSQLMKITNIAPTYVVDPYYVRSETPYNNEDEEFIWNEKPSPFVYKTIDNIPVRVFSDETNLNEVLPESYLTSEYCKYKHLNLRIDLSKGMKNGGVTWQIVEPGSGYTEGSRFTFLIGGLTFEGWIDSVDEDGSVLSIRNESDLNRIVNIANVYPNIVHSVEVNGSGSGLKIYMNITDDLVDGLTPKPDGVNNPLYTFKLDQFGNLFVYTYEDGNWITGTEYQITGTTVVESPYDDKDTQTKRSTKSVYLESLFHKVTEFNGIVRNVSVKETSTETNEISNDNTTSEVSHYLSGNGFNRQDTYYLLTTNEENNNTIITSYELWEPNKRLINPEMFVFASSTMANEFPRFHKMSLSEYYPKSTKISWKQYGLTQPTLYVFNPFKTDIEYCSTLSKDIQQFAYSNPMTIRELNSSIVNMNDHGDGVLTENLYYYNEYKYSDIYQETIDTYQNASIADIKNRLLELVSEDKITPLQYDDTEYAYSQEMWFRYLLDTVQSSPIYNQNAKIEVLREKGDTVIHRVSRNKYEPVGDQIKGGYVSLTDSVFDPRVIVDNISNQTSILYVFRIKEVIDSFNGFRMKDENDNDISEYTLLICNHKLYVYDSDNDTWITVKRKS